MSTVTASKRLRCAPLHAAREVDPAGSAPYWDAVLVMEVPGPWPRDISEAEPFRSLCEPPSATITGSDGRTWRPQGIVPAKDASGVRVIAHESPQRSAGPMERREWLLPHAAPDASAFELAKALLSGHAASVDRFAEFRDDPPEGTVDFLLCTHGKRDICCGSSGTALFKQLDEQIAAGSFDGVRLFRSSHAGGHRFAPTGLSFPEAVSWSHLDPATLAAILRREGDPRELGAHVRGAVTIEDPHAQVVDREGFVRHGWAWFLSGRSSSTISKDPDGEASSVEVVASLPEGRRAAVRASVELAEWIPRPPCGAEDPSAGSEEPVWRVVGAG